MKKILLLLLLGLTLGATAVGYTYLQKNTQVPQKQPLETSSGSDNTHSGSGESITEEPPLSREEIVRKKIERIKKRHALKGLIIEGDSHFRGGQLALALKKYLEFYKQNPDDTLINQKIGDTYFEMHKYGSAANYYMKISSLDDAGKYKLTLSNFYSTDLKNPEKRQKLKEKILALELPEDQEYYFLNSLLCSTDFHACKKSFGEYFWPETSEIVIEGEEKIVKETTFPELLAIKQAIQSYRNFRVDDVYFKDAYIIGAYFSNEMYNLAILLGNSLLEEKKDYKPIIKIIAQSHYELGNFEESRSMFNTYYEIDKTDAAVVYSLGIINTKLREYVLANINFHKALELDYPNTTDVYKQLILNYDVLDDTEKMLSMFEKLIESEQYSQSDLQLAIYYHIIYDKYDTALSWTKIGKEAFPESGNFHGYEGWILREQGEVEFARSILENGLAREADNPFILINLAYTLIEEGNSSAATVLFKQIIAKHPQSEFALQAQKELDTLSSGEQTAQE